MVEPILKGVGLKKTYQVGENPITVISNLDIAIRPQEITAVIGPSGTGKSTLLYVLSGLEKPEQGHVFLDGQDIYTMSDEKLSNLRASTFGFIFQSFNLINTMTALENVEIPLRLTNAPRPEQRAKEMLEKVGLGPRMHHRPGQLSGGEQQRVAVARALSLNPRMIFADEPTGNLDYDTGREIVALIVSLVREQNAACLLVTHNPEWSELADRVINLVQVGKEQKHD